MKRKIKYVKYAVANTFSDGTIELHKDLKKYPKLHNKILAHELKHNVGRNTKEDLKNDFTTFYGLDLFLFMIKRPRTWIQISPILFANGKWHLDINLFIAYALAITLFGLLIHFFNLVV